MRDPGLVAVDPVGVALAHRARLQRGEVGAGIRLGEHRRRQHLAGRDLGQPLAFLFLGAAAENKLGGDLGTRAEAADPDIAARQLLGHDAHRFLAEPHAAVILGDGEAEHAELGHLRNHVERNVGVAQMPLLGARSDLVVGELAHLLADRLERLVETAGADRRLLLPLAHERGEPRAARRRIARGDEVLDRRGHPRGHGGRAEPEIGWTHDLALAHGNAAEHLRQIFAGADAHQEVFDLAEIVGLHEPLRICRKLSDRLHIGREPGKPVRGALFAVERARDRAAVDRHPLGDGAAGVREQRLGGRNPLAQRRNQFEARWHGGCGKRHDDSNGFDEMAGADGPASLLLHCTKANAAAAKCT